MTQREIQLCHALRTPIGAFNGALRSVPASALGAVAVRAVLQRSGADPDAIGGVVMGHVVQAGCRMNPARQAALDGGLPVSIPAMTVNRVCGSGAQAIITAAQQIASGEIDCAIAGGFENMDRAPYLLDNGRWGYRTWRRGAMRNWRSWRSGNWRGRRMGWRRVPWGMDGGTMRRNPAD